MNGDFLPIPQFFFTNLCNFCVILLETNGREWVVNMVDIIFLSTVSVSYNFTCAYCTTLGRMNFFTSATKQALVKLHLAYAPFTLLRHPPCLLPSAAFRHPPIRVSSFVLHSVASHVKRLSCTQNFSPC